jgi:isopentenyl-diphosphate Delta-isomerase
MDSLDDSGSEALILVDEEDKGVGFLDKTACHQGRGILHRAFSLLIFNDDGDLLIQQRSPAKRLWPLYWSNSCCSHPRSTETLEIATKRRLSEELGIDCPLLYLYKFQYQAQFDATGAENELCSVYVGATSEDPVINTAEINDWRWVSPQSLQDELATQGGRTFTPWFMLEWTRIWRDHRSAVLSLVI